MGPKAPPPVNPNIYNSEVTFLGHPPASQKFEVSKKRPSRIQISVRITVEVA